LHPTFKKMAMLTLCLLASPSFLAAQQSAVKRNVTPRSDPSTASPAIELLRSGATLTMLDSSLQGGFYHVKAAGDQEGWVWSRNIIVPLTSPTAPQVPSAIPPGAAAQCDDSLWKHVYNPQRLIVKQMCISVTGTIVDATNGKRRGSPARSGRGHARMAKLGPSAQESLECRKHEQ
jgi:hypothetical protein